MDQGLELFLGDKVVIDPILFSVVGPPCGVAGSVKTGAQRRNKDVGEDKYFEFDFCISPYKLLPHSEFLV